MEAKSPGPVRGIKVQRATFWHVTTNPAFPPLNRLT